MKDIASCKFYVLQHIPPKKCKRIWQINIFVVPLWCEINRGNMKRQHFTAQIVTKKGDVFHASLEVVLFRKVPYTIAYCPALDLSAAAANQKAVKEEFAQVFAEYAEDCIKNNTLREDLQAHNWAL